MATETRPGSTFAGYLIVGTAGRGGMGIVYRARELALDRPVALKLIAPELAEDPSFRARFLRESRIAASLDHPAILPVYAAGEADGELFIATRFVEGTDLRTLLAREGPLAPARALKIVGQIAEALDAAHRRGLVHRDVKPGNVLVDASDNCYLCDFGLTKELADEGTAASDPLAGSLEYLAPEQIRREEVDGRADQYALACVLYECLAGTPPFRRENAAQTLWAHMQEPPDRLGDLPYLEAVLTRALAKEPSERFESCAAFVEGARSALGLGVAPAPAGRSGRRTGLLLLAAGIALAAAVAAAAAVALVLSLGGKPGGLVVPPNSLAALDPESGELVATIALEGVPTLAEIAASDEWVWVTVVGEWGHVISRIDVESKSIAETLTVRGLSHELLAAAGSLWISTRQGHVFRVDPSTDKVLGDWTLPNAGRGVGDTSVLQGVGSLAYGGGKIWAASYRAISHIDPTTSKLTPRRSTVWGPLAYGFGSIWVLPTEGVDFYRLDPGTLQPLARIPFPNDLFAVRDVAVGEEKVWVTHPLTRVDEFDLEGERLVVGHRIGGHILGLAVGGGAVWATSDDDVIVRIDAATGDTSRIEVDGTPLGIAFGGGLVWVSVGHPDL